MTPTNSASHDGAPTTFNKPKPRCSASAASANAASGMHSRMTTDPSATSVSCWIHRAPAGTAKARRGKERFPHGDHTERSQPQIRLQIGLVLEQPAGHGLFRHLSNDAGHSRSRWMQALAATGARTGVTAIEARKQVSGSTSRRQYNGLQSDASATAEQL